MGRLLALLLAEGSLVALVHREAATRFADPTGLLVVPPTDLVVALLHGAAWLAAWWLLVGTVHDLVVQSRRGARGRRVAPLWVQRVVGQAVGTVLAVGVVATPVGAATAPSPPALQVVAPPVPPLALPPPSTPVPAPAADTPPAVPAETSPAAPAETPSADEDAAAPDQPPAPAGAATSGAPSDRPEPPTAASAPGTHVVAAGENLWTIARQQLLDAGQPHADRDVHARWIALIRANADVLRSGDPDLIHPGEVLQLPPDGVVGP